MVEFRFDLKPLFPQPIVKVTSNLLPHTFRGDRRQCLEATTKMSEIIDKLGQLSAVSQKLTKPVTTAQRLRMSDNQIIYLLVDVEDGHNGSVLGLLKVGTKDLYLFDEAGQTQKVDNTPCILDFYIHESRQRAGLGKKLFEAMLAEEHWTPLKCSIDRPSEKLLGFMKKHYGLVKTIPQANNFVLYEGFFKPAEEKPPAQHQQHHNDMHITNRTEITISRGNSPNTQLFGAHYLGDDDHKRHRRQQDAPNVAAQITQISPVGRYGARRPTCSMAEARKNPLDALSRMSLRHQTVEKRSGLQDVDDEYMKRNIFTKHSFAKHSGLNENYDSRAQLQHQLAAGHSPLSQTESAYKLQVGADGAPITSSQMQLQVQQQQALSQAQMQQMQMQAQAQAQAQAQHQHHQQHQAQQHQQQQQAPPVPAQSLMPPQMQCKNQSYKESHIIQNKSASANTGAESGSELVPFTDKEDDEALDTLAEDMQNLHTNDKFEVETHVTLRDTSDEAADIPSDATELQDPSELTVDMDDVNEVKFEIQLSQNDGRSKTPSITETFSFKKPTPHKPSKQHTGMKNISFGVGMAVTPTGKMEFDQEEKEDFGVVKLNRPIGKLASPPPMDDIDAMSTVSSTEGYTDQGYHDLKFFHNKLW